ncbi:hypothetical protein EI42_01571 [Thermosporothrix hazakensis]|uniref:DUF4878 domain-containing protein n=1 Tax=Thermosporothrix hazakensis TaxID=644383 RepID=A0A326UAB0_THEHA|nr:hypothetical protein [Thermosporothrix hazakensis]PZW33021.1 hypothetical protein EI42_01571 [Thermosporothrix hazakensis]GCE49052.1 hypothetical protein KTH_39210 [Thermosporothrix hazakensis]
MQGRQGREGESRETPLGRKAASVNGSGRQPTIPQRPPGMTRVSKPPATRKVERPKRENNPQGARKRALILLGVLVLCAAVSLAGGYGLFNLVKGIQASAGPSQTISSFLVALDKQDYQNAYTYLGAGITLQQSQEQFANQAKQLDACYGKVIDYSQQEGSAVYEENGNIQKYSYTIKREHMEKPYTLVLTVQQEQDTGDWKISDYGTLGPDKKSAPACATK